MAFAPPPGNPGKVILREEQRWRSAWAVWLLAPAGLFLTGVFGYAIFRQVFCDAPFDPRPLVSIAIGIYIVLMALLGCSLLWLAVSGGLITEVREDALYVRHYPLTRWHCFPYKHITHCEARHYRPVAEYGGWGVRYGFLGGGKAYNVSGNEGVQLEFADGTKLLIGSLLANEVATAIDRCREKEKGENP